MYCWPKNVQLSMPWMMSGLELGQCVTSGWWVAWSYWVQCETRGESVCVVCQCKTLVHWQGEPGECVCVCGMQQQQGSIWSVVVSQWWPVWLVKVVPPVHSTCPQISLDKLTLTPVREKERQTDAGPYMGAKDIQKTDMEKSGLNPVLSKETLSPCLVESCFPFS